MFRGASMGKLSVGRQSSSSIDGTLHGTKLPRMSHPRFLRTSSILLTSALLGSGACDRSAPATRNDSSTATGSKDSVGTPRMANTSGWASNMGPAVFIQGEDREEAIVLLPTESEGTSEEQLAALAASSVDVVLFGRGGIRMTAKLASAPTGSDAECRLWTLRSIHGDGTDATWAVGFMASQVSSLALDSIEVLSSRDSLALAAEASRLASGVTATTSPSFQGLRFAAHDVRRFEAAPGVQALVAHLIRKVNQEANPQEEQTLLIAERDSGVTTGPYQLVYAERTNGVEETTTTPEVIGAVLIAGRPTLVVARDGDEGVAYAFLERAGKRQWKIRWTSALTRCG
jgi:hypothetical protein